MLSQLECPVLVDFYAQWCGPCKMMQPVLEDIAGRMDDKIKVAKVDTDRSPRLGARYQVEALPTLILFNKGEVVERYIGYMTADELEYAVQTTLNRLAQAPSM
jgi:thioredoxin 1